MDDEGNVVDFRPRDRAPAGLPPLPVSMPPAPSEAASAAVSAEAVEAAVESAVRRSPFDVPLRASAPPLPTTTTVSRSEPAEVGPPATGSVGLAALLAMALKAFEGISAWGQEAGPRRVEAAKRKHELALLRAKAGLDMAKLAGQAAATRGKSAGGSGPSGGGGAKKGAQGASGGSTRPVGSSGSTAPRKGSTAPSGASGHAGGGKAPKGGKSPSGGSSPLHGGKVPAGGGKASKGVSTAPGKGKTTGPDSPTKGKGGSGSGRTTLGQAAGKAAADRWKKREPGSPVLSKTNGKGKVGKAGGGKSKPTKAGKGAGPKGSGTSADGRTTLGQAATETMQGRWEKRRSGSPKPEAKGSPKAKAKASSEDDERTTVWGAAKENLRGRWAGREHTPPFTKAEPTSGGTEDASGPSWAWRPRSSAWDAAPAPDPTTFTVERDDHQAQPAAPKAISTGPRALPRAPQRPAGQRPGTTRKEPAPMTTAPATTAATPGGMSPQHATEVTLEDVLLALEGLLQDGMDTHDECHELTTKARRLLAALEAMAADLATAHNVTGPRTTAALHDLTEAVAHLAAEADRMAKVALEAAEVAEAEEMAMHRDHRMLADATADAGLTTPSTRTHNED